MHATTTKPCSRAKSRIGCLAACLFPLSLLLGCAAKNFVARGHAGAAAVHEVLLFPLNVGMALPPAVEAGVERVSEELGGYLEIQAKEVQPVPLSDALLAWRRSTAEFEALGGDSQPSFEAVARLLARDLSKVRSFDMLVLPWISLRPAEARGRSVKWDGVTRKLAVEPSSMRNWFSAHAHFQARLWSPSLQILAFSPDGEKIFEGAGGLDLLHEILIENPTTALRLVISLRSEVLEDRTLIREGIAVAFDPLLPRPEP